MMKLFTFLLLSASYITTTGAARESDILRALSEVAASSQHDIVTVQDLLEGPPELTIALPLFNQLVREDRQQLLLQIGEQHYLADGSVPHNVTHAELFLQTSADYGSAQAQFLLGALRASSDDSAGSQLYYEFAARGQSIGASMALGYRALHGYSSPKSCTAALRHYKSAADRVVALQSDQKLQLYAFPAIPRLSETEGARYHTDLSPADDFNRAEYLRQRAADLRNSDVMVQSASITLFSDLYETTVVSDLAQHSARKQAIHFLERSIDMGSSKAQALLGHVYAYGLAGNQVNATRAVELYEAALNASQGKPSGEAANGLGVIFSRGIGDVPVDLDRARSLFKVAANAGHAEGVYNTGMAFLRLGAQYSSRAKEYFVAAAHVGHLKSLFQLARMKQRQIYSIGGATSSASCEEVVELYKRVAEYSRKGTELMTKALTHVQRGNWAVALEIYLIAAEMGYEIAQSNAIWLIQRVQTQVFGASSARSKKQLERLYNRLLRRAVEQDSVDALIRMGDTAFGDEEYTLALRHYQHADLVSAGTCGQALYSVGYMYEHGHGVSLKSPERAILYYHLAGEKESSLRIVMTLLQFKLRVQSSFEQAVDMAQWIWLASTSPNDEVTAIEDVSSKMLHDTEEGSTPTSRGMSELESSFQQPINTLSDSVSFTDAATRSDPHEYAAALQFVGDQSQVHVEFGRGELPLEQQDFTIETWIRIDDFPTQSDDQQVITLVDALDNFQLELLPATKTVESSNWMLKFRKFSLIDEQLPVLELSFPSAPLIPHTWNHVALTFEARHQTVTLMVNGTVKQVLSFRPHPAALSRDATTDDGASSTQFLAVGSSIGRIYGINPLDSRAFSGQLVHFRLWKSHKNVKEISVLMLEQYDEMATRDLLVHLRYKIRGAEPSGISHSNPTTVRVMNGDYAIPNAQGIQFTIVQFPPSNN